MSLSALTAVAFLASLSLAVLAAGGAWLVLAGRRGQPGTVPAGSLPGSQLIKEDKLSTISLWEALLGRFDFVAGMKTRIAEAGLSWSVGRLTAMVLLAGSVALFVFTRLRASLSWWMLAATGLCALSPYLLVLRLRARRLARIEEQLPEALDFLARALRAGHPFAGAMHLLSQERMQPLAAEIRKTVDETKLGLDWEQAFDGLRGRVPIPEVHIFCAAALVHRRTGGKLNEILLSIAGNMRERFALRGEVRALSSHARLTALLLTVLPLVLVLLLAAVNPGYLELLLRHPNGQDLIAAAAACLVLAHLVIRRLTAVRT